MVLTRRRALRTAGVAGLAALAGCSTDGPFGAGEPTRTYTLHVDRIDADPTEYALYRPDEDALFGDPARAALAAILPDGRHTTYGYTPLPADAYVEHDGTYYQTKHVVTGRKRMARRLVRVDSVPREQVPEDAILVDDLDRPSARVVKILHSYTQTDGETSTADLLRGDAYVLRRPAERESRLATGDLDGRVVTMTESGAWAYRVRVSREPLRETAYTALAVEVADSRPAFREVVFGSRIDAELDPGSLSAESRGILEEAIDLGEYDEQAPVSAAFDALLDALGVGGVETASNGNLLWYDGGFYRYALYVNIDD
ncbi:MAG: hypothetical protein ABEJ74_06390 [Haloferacaceae archaeon]